MWDDQFTLLALAAALAPGFLAGKRARSWPLVTLGMTTLVALGFAMQLIFPPLLDALARDPAILRGQAWRLLTAIFVQDAGFPGALFNLVALLRLGAAAEQRFERMSWLIIYFGGGVAAEAVALVWQPHGAGNSVAYFSLAGALALQGVTREKPLWLGLHLIGFIAGAALLAMRDIHGVGFLAGAAVGALLAAAERNSTIS